MESNRSNEPEATELDAAEATSPGAFGTASSAGSTPEQGDEASSTDRVICPYCDRPVEPGFKFCDWCGKPLVKADGADEKPTATLVSPPEPKAQAPRKRFSWRGRRAEPIFGRPDVAAKPPAAPPLLEPLPWEAKLGTEVTDKEPASTPPAPTKPADTTPIASAPIPPAATLPPTAGAKVDGGLTVGALVSYVLHLVVSFFAGTLVVFVAAAIVTLVTQGDKSFLEMRGLPVFAGVASAVAAFAILRGTSKDPTGRPAQVLAIAGFVAIVTGGALLYRPVLLTHAQVRLERLVGVWSDQDRQAVSTYQQDLDSWNSTFTEYKGLVTRAFGSKVSGDEFKSTWANLNSALDQAATSMGTHASSATNKRLRSALTDLAALYERQLTGVRLISDGIVNTDASNVQRGDAAYKAAKKAAGTLFSTRLRALFDRAGFDAGTFDNAVNA